MFESPVWDLNSEAFGYKCSGNTVYIFGGNSFAEFSNQLMKFEFITKTQAVRNFSRGMTVPTSRQGHAMEVFNDNLYILGGKNKEGNDLGDMYTFDLKTEAWKPLIFESNDALSPRSEFAHTRMGEILIIFGGTSNSKLLGDMHYFNLRTSEWKAVVPKSNDIPIARKGSCMAAVGNSIFIFGGVTIDGYSEPMVRSILLTR